VAGIIDEPFGPLGVSEPIFVGGGQWVAIAEQRQQLRIFIAPKPRDAHDQGLSPSG
jgi:hypothetical protein